MPRKVPAKPAPGKHRIGRTIMFTPEMLGELDAVADAEGRSFSGMVTRLLETVLTRRHGRRAA